MCDREVTNSKICTKCGDASYTTLAPTGHTFTERVVEPNCTEGGYTEYTCHCGSTYKSNISSAKGHDFKKTDIPPSCQKEGYTVMSCTICDYSYLTDFIAALGHTFEKTTTNKIKRFAR